MTQYPTYCRGITISGNPCKIKVKEGAYCRYHKDQAGRNDKQRKDARTVNIPGSFDSPHNKGNAPKMYPSIKPIQQPNPRKPGYIYIYTYEKLFNSFVNGSTEELSWLKLDNSVLTHKNSDRRLEWNNRNEILCKIGMTTKANVQLRLNEWEQSCSFKIVNLTMDNVNTLIRNVNRPERDANKLSKLMSKLSLKKKNNKDSHAAREVRHDITLRSFKNGGYYNDARGKMTLQDIENSLHQLFWKKYGKGIIHCSGCHRTGEDYKRHIEWFLIPIMDLPTVLETIDNFCYA